MHLTIGITRDRLETVIHRNNPMSIQTKPSRRSTTPEKGGDTIAPIHSPQIRLWHDEDYVGQFLPCVPDLAYRRYAYKRENMCALRAAPKAV